MKFKLANQNFTPPQNIYIKELIFLIFSKIFFFAKQLFKFGSSSGRVRVINCCKLQPEPDPRLFDIKAKPAQPDAGLYNLGYEVIWAKTPFKK